MLSDELKTAYRSNRGLWDKRVAAHRRDTTGFYQVDAFLAGKDVLYPIEAAELGDVRGLRIAHLQCHFGMDSICLARRGAEVVGVDFSGPAMAEARALVRRTETEVRFVEGNHAGLRLEWIREHSRLPWPCFPNMERDDDRMYVLAERFPQVPLALSLRAAKL